MKPRRIDGSTKYEKGIPFFRKLYSLCFPLLLLFPVSLVYAQEVKLNLDIKNETLLTIFKEVEKQTGYTFFYGKEVIDVTKKTSINVKEAELSTVLNQLFSPYNVNFEIQDTHIVLSKKQTDSGNSTSKNQVQTNEQERGTAPGKSTGLRQMQVDKITIKGVIIDGQDKAPVEFATIMVKGTKEYATSDAQGNYSITTNASNGILVFSQIGYKTMEEPINGRSLINITLNPDITLLQDVIVTGYSTIAKERVTGAYGQVQASELKQKRAPDIASALQGMIAGLQSKSTADGSGFRIRGASSLHVDSSPLIVVDGFPVSTGFSSINPDDVVNVTVLKDAAAASIWGARSANGVIVVTTKQGQGKLNISASATIRIGAKPDLDNALTTASSEDQIAFEQLAFGTTWDFSNYMGMFSDLTNPVSLGMEALYLHKSGEITDARLNKRLQELSVRNNRQQIHDELMRNPILQQYNLSLSGSSDKSKNYFSAMYERSFQEMVRNNSDNIRINYNNQTSVFKWLDFNVSTNLNYRHNNTSGASLSEITMLSPYEMLLNPDGSYGLQINGINRVVRQSIPPGALPYEDWNYNLLREVRARDLSSESLRTRIQAGLKFKIYKGLDLESKIQYEYNRTETTNLYSPDSYMVRNMVNRYVDYDQINKTVLYQFIPKGSIQQNSLARENNYVWRNQLNYSGTFGKHSIAALAGMELSEYLTEIRTNPWVYGYNPDKNTSVPLPYGSRNINDGTQRIVIKDIMGRPLEGSLNGADVAFGYRNDRYVSVFTNITYSFDGKYSLSGSVRSDASNIISDDPKYRWAPLWSIGGMWNMHKESFFNLPAINRLSLRATYGYNGNVDKTTSLYTLIDMGNTPSTTTGFPVAVISSHGNPKLGWERTSTLNVGVDFALFDNLLYGNVDAYTKHGKDIIGLITLPDYSGSSSQRINQAEINNRGVEVMLGTDYTFDKIPLSLSTQVTYSYNRNEITKLNRQNITVFDIMMNGAYVGGYPVNSLWSYTYLGMKNDEPYVAGPEGTEFPMSDINPFMQGLGKDYLQYEGSAIPTQSLGWNINLHYGGWNLSCLLMGSFGGHFIAPSFNYATPFIGNKYIISKYVKDVIGPDHDPNKTPSLPSTADNRLSAWDRYSSFLNTLVESSDFIKLKEITLSYDIPEILIKKAGLGSASVFGQVRDLGCLWTANEYGYDPEFLPGSMKPVTKYAIGININF